MPIKKQYHILNGDCLKEQFPSKIKGEVIVARECLVDGDVSGQNLKELYQTRAHYLSQNYGGTIADYYTKAVQEFNKIIGLKNCDIHLWFEDDLFCQVNFWFVLHLIITKSTNNNLYLIRPNTDIKYGFGVLDNSTTKFGESAKITARKRWSVPNLPKDTFAPF